MAAKAMLDEHHARLKCHAKADENNYVLGNIGEHNIAIACLPEYGTISAAIAAKSMQSTFPHLRFGLMVGIGGGIPSEDNDIRLGDICVSLPTEQHGGVVQYDIGREEADGFHRLGMLNKPPTLLRTAVMTLKATKGIGKEITTLVNLAFKDDNSADEDEDEEWTYPETTVDVLFKPTFDHNKENRDCVPCHKSSNEIVKRDKRKGKNPRLFYGNIGSGNKVMKNGLERDNIAARDKIICFEMEAAGLMDSFPCLVIRGICDYADSHKNKKWQKYAAVVAAAYAKILLTKVPGGAGAGLYPIQSEFV